MYRTCVCSNIVSPVKLVQIKVTLTARYYVRLLHIKYFIH